MYEQQSWLSRQDVAILLTATKREWNGGLSFIGGACTIWEKADYGAVVINDDGNFQSAPAASHELAHSYVNDVYLYCVRSATGLL